MDRNGNVITQEGCDRCVCGCKYWEKDTCTDCGATPVLDAEFVEIVGKLDMNEVAAFGSAALSENDPNE